MSSFFELELRENEPGIFYKLYHWASVPLQCAEYFVGEWVAYSSALHLVVAVWCWFGSILLLSGFLFHRSDPGYQCTQWTGLERLYSSIIKLIYNKAMLPFLILNISINVANRIQVHDDQVSSVHFQSLFWMINHFSSLLKSSIGKNKERNKMQGDSFCPHFSAQQ